MAFLKGTDIQMGVGREATRGTYQAPSIWVPGRSPTGIHAITDKVNIKETTGTSVPTTGSAVIAKRVEGDFEFNIRDRSVGYFLLSLFGTVNTTTLASGVYQHVFTILNGNPQYPTLSLALAALGTQDYKYLRNIVNSFEMRTPLDDLVNATVGFVGASESTQADYTPALATTDYYFRPQDVEVKIATNLAGIAGASALALKENSLSITNGARINRNISDVNPSDVLAIMHEITGSIALDYNGETNHDLYVAGTPQAMQIKLERADVNLGTAITPKLTFLMPQVTFESLDPDRPIDDIVKEGLTYMAHHDVTAGYAIQATLVNGNASYAT